MPKKSQSVKLTRHFLVTEDGNITAVVIPVEEYEKFLEEVRDQVRGTVSSRKAPARKPKSRREKRR